MIFGNLIKTKILKRFDEVTGIPYYSLFFQCDENYRDNYLRMSEEQLKQLGEQINEIHNTTRHE